MDRVLRNKLSLLANSSRRGMNVIEVQPGKWYSIVAHNEDDDQFYEGHNTYGPFKNADLAAQAVYDNESNPGGHMVVKHSEVTDRDRDLVKRGVQQGSGGGGDYIHRDELGRFA